MRDVLGRRDIRLLLAGQAISQAGDWLYSVALIVWMLDVTGSPGWAAAAALARLLPWIFVSPIGGLIADRYDRRRVLMACDLVQVATMLALASVAATGGPPGVALAIALIAATTAVVASPSLQASWPLLIEERQLVSVNVVMSGIMSMSMILGPGALALLLLLGSPAAAFGLNALTFAASAVCFLLVRTPMGPFTLRDPGLADQTGGGSVAADDPEGAQAGVVAALNRAAIDLATGVRVLASSRDAAVLVFVSASVLFTYGAQTVLWAVLADDRLGGGTDSVTLLYVAYGIGGLLAAAPASRASAGRLGALVIAGSVAIGGLAVVALAISSELVPTLALVGLQGLVVTVAEVLLITLLQRTLGVATLGRALGARDSVTSFGLVAGVVLAPVMINASGLPAAFVAGAVVLLTAGAVSAVVIGRQPAITQSQEAHIEMLARLSLFAGAPRFALEGLAAAGTVVSAARSTVVIREGAVPDDLFVLIDGRARVTAGLGDRELSLLEAGDFFGEIGLLRGTARTATVTVTEAATMLRIPGDVFLTLVRQDVVHRGALGRTVGVRLARGGTDAAEVVGST